MSIYWYIYIYIFTTNEPKDNRRRTRLCSTEPREENPDTNTIEKYSSKTLQGQEQGHARTFVKENIIRWGAVANRHDRLETKHPRFHEARDAQMTLVANSIIGHGENQNREKIDQKDPRDNPWGFGIQNRVKGRVDVQVPPVSTRAMNTSTPRGAWIYLCEYIIELIYYMNRAHILYE